MTFESSTTPVVQGSLGKRSRQSGRREQRAQLAAANRGKPQPQELVAKRFTSRRAALIAWPKSSLRRSARLPTTSAFITGCHDVAPAARCWNSRGRPLRDLRARGPAPRRLPRRGASPVQHNHAERRCQPLAQFASKLCPQGVTLPHGVVDRLDYLREPGQSYSNVIFALLTG